MFITGFLVVQYIGEDIFHSIKDKYLQFTE